MTDEPSCICLFDIALFNIAVILGRKTVTRLIKDAFYSLFQCF